MADVSIAIPVLDGGELFRGLLAAVHRQVGVGDVELVVADSGSTDGSRQAALAAGARVIDLAPGEFSHGGTRNLLMQETRGAHVAFLTQDAEPLGTGWLAALLSGFREAEDVGLAFGPYVPRPDASAAVSEELTGWFRSFSPDGTPRVDRLDGPELPLSLLGPRAFFTDANGCVSRAAWRRAPFRAVPYAEDHRLALDMLAAGYAKVFVPGAAVLHSHDYGPWDLLRRSFDEWRGLREVYGFVEPLDLAAMRRNVLGPARRRPRTAAHQVVRYAGALLGSRADRLRPAIRERLSLERRSTFEPSWR